jgi:hypothetical protein
MLFYFNYVVYSLPVSWLCWSVRVKRDASLWRSLKSITGKLIVVPVCIIYWNLLGGIFLILYSIVRTYRNGEMGSFGEKQWLLKEWRYYLLLPNSRDPSKNCAENWQLEWCILSHKTNLNVIICVVVTRRSWLSLFWSRIMLSLTS